MCVRAFVRLCLFAFLCVFVSLCVYVRVLTRGAACLVMRNMTPPIIPKLSNAIDTSNFRHFDDARFDMEREQGLAAHDLNAADPFRDFESSTHLSLSHTHRHIHTHSVCERARGQPASVACTHTHTHTPLTRLWVRPCH
jgi:ABC-type nickel/cobalt efflux system permease component RcnA